MNISVRGTGTIGSGSNSSPLILIDGMVGDINTVNPQDIENISVLKDAAASSYLWFACTVRCNFGYY